MSEEMGTYETSVDNVLLIPEPNVEIQLSSMIHVIQSSVS